MFTATGSNEVNEKGAADITNRTHYSDTITASKILCQEQTFGHLSECRSSLLQPARWKSRPCRLSHFSAAAFISLSEKCYVPDKSLEPRMGAKSGLYGLGSGFRDPN
ncbi:hypothetical protein AVEN_172374-1 [Araneus ventricosus]|uniref:Uncharacterized protein n=1 Tax=Araneus ventricosus TaxID=182803 RepID=A0A4Y2U8F1_ARAVE|nr:hypothetical protein AVEN_217500-1 [Araneus ventricosus]GBO07845.1 hypothetical protein AVEN_172374-1 [Araneus ventricosus]